MTHRPAALGQQALTSVVSKTIERGQECLSLRHYSVLYNVCCDDETKRQSLMNKFPPSLNFADFWFDRPIVKRQSDGIVGPCVTGFIDVTRKCGNYSDVLPLKAARRDSINSEGG